MTALLDWNPALLSSSFDFPGVVGSDHSSFSSPFDLPSYSKEHPNSSLTAPASPSSSDSVSSFDESPSPLSPAMRNFPHHSPLTAPASPVRSDISDLSVYSQPVKSEWSHSGSSIKDEWAASARSLNNAHHHHSTHSIHHHITHSSHPVHPLHDMPPPSMPFHHHHHHPHHHHHHHHQHPGSPILSSSPYTSRNLSLTNGPCRSDADYHTHSHHDRLGSSPEQYPQLSPFSGQGTIPPSQLHHPRHQPPHYHAAPPYHIWRGLPSAAAPRTPFARPMSIMPPILDGSPSGMMSAPSEQFSAVSPHMLRPSPLLIPSHSYSAPTSPTLTPGLPTPPPDHPLHPYSRGRRSKSWQGGSTSSNNNSSAGKIFTCAEDGCGKSFKRAEHLNRHSRMHTGERPFPCDEPGCDRRFSRSDNLAAHKRTHLKHKAKAAAQHAHSQSVPVHMNKIVRNNHSHY